ncbi:MAG TPA: outer membrane beta-barrel protein [Candidatus Angelobacter sp.]|nr:outer membrane beta-barrel protein [Candidatus Angelobacter sp.]
MKRIMLAALAFGLLAMGSYAQDMPKADVAGGYSMLHLNGSGGAPGTNLNGFGGSATFNANSWLGVVADFGVYHGSPSGVGLTASTYTFGPRISFRRSSRFTPFGQALFGGAHLSALGATSNPFAYSFGGGSDIGLSSSGSISLRPQFEYFGFRSNGATQNAERFSVGIVYHFGSK